MSEHLGDKVQRGGGDNVSILFLFDERKSLGLLVRRSDCLSFGSIENGLSISVEIDRISKATLDFHDDSMTVLLLTPVEKDTEIDIVSSDTLGLGVLEVCLNRSLPEDCGDTIRNLIGAGVRDKDRGAFEGVEFWQDCGISQLPSRGPNDIDRWSSRGLEWSSADRWTSREDLLVEGDWCKTRIERGGATDSTCDFFSNVIFHVKCYVHWHTHTREGREGHLLIVAIAHDGCVVVDAVVLVVE
jgi:hypothetical protein